MTFFCTLWPDFSKQRCLSFNRSHMFMTQPWLCVLIDIVTGRCYMEMLQGDVTWKTWVWFPAHPKSQVQWHKPVPSYSEGCGRWIRIQWNLFLKSYILGIKHYIDSLSHSFIKVSWTFPCTLLGFLIIWLESFYSSAIAII